MYLSLIHISILLSTLFQIFMIIYIIVVLVHPLQAYARILEHLNKTEFESEELRMAPAGVPFVKETYSLLDRYAAYKTRKNNAQILNKQTELTALQSQINPHFLYNTLETIRGQALIDDNEEIAKMVEALSAFFRYSISRKGNLVTLRDELANIETVSYTHLDVYKRQFRRSVGKRRDQLCKTSYGRSNCCDKRIDRIRSGRSGKYKLQASESTKRVGADTRAFTKSADERADDSYA